jgi:hypothetical protein
MGIRYYAYAFNPDQTEEAFAEPRNFLSRDPLADAWGLEPGAQISYTTFEQSVPASKMLYLDKAWSELQQAYAPARADGSRRPAYRMFEGNVTMHDLGWEPWVRALSPAEIGVIADDLRAGDLAAAPLVLNPGRLLAGSPTALSEYAGTYLDRARIFMTNLAAEGRGMVYMIG